MNNHYFTLDYLSHSRWNSFWYQIKETLESSPASVLEVGKGSGLLTFVLTELGVSVTTIDPDKRLAPHKVGDVRKLPFKDSSFDTVTCFQVLEHIPFADVPKAISELARVSKKNVIISIPEPYNSFIAMSLKLIPFLRKTTFVRKITLFPSLLKKLPKGGTHHWELNRPGFSESSLKTIFLKNSLSITKTFCPEENLYHRFYVLSKKK